MALLINLFLNSSTTNNLWQNKMYKLFHNTTIQHCQIFTAVCEFCSNTNGGWWRWALGSPDGVALSRMVGVSASGNLPLHHKVHKFSSGTGLPGWSRKRGRKMVVVWIMEQVNYCHQCSDSCLGMRKSIKKTRKPRKGAAVIAASMHGFGNCRSSNAPWPWPWPWMGSRSHKRIQYM